MNDTISSPNHRCLFDIASSQAGYFTATQGRVCGFSHALLSHHAATGKFIRVRRGLYRLSEYPSSRREEVMAAWLAIGSDVAVISHQSALDLMRLSDVVPDEIHLTVPRSHRGRKPVQGVRIHTSLRPPGRDEVFVREGMKMTTPVRAIVDATKDGMPAEHVLAAIQQALERGMATRAQFAAAGERAGGRVAKLIDEALAGPVQT